MHWLPWWCYPAGCCILVGMGGGFWLGWWAGYAHRELVELGRRYGRLLMWRQMHRWRPLARLAGAYRGLWRAVLGYSAQGREPVARVNARAAGR